MSPAEVIKKTFIFEDLDEAASAFMAGGEGAKTLLTTLNAGIITKDKNIQRTAMRPADPKAEFNRARNAAVESMLAEEIDEGECLAIIKAAATARDEALAGDILEEEE